MGTSSEIGGMKPGDRVKLPKSVEVKITAGKSISMRGPCNHLIVLKVVSPRHAEIIFDGSGIGLWEDAGKTASNGQRRVSLAKLRRLAAAHTMG